MTQTKNTLAAVLLLGALSYSPINNEKSPTVHRGIASIIESSTPKYQARADKIDQSKLELKKDIDLTQFSEIAEAYRNKLLKFKSEYKITEIDSKKVEDQKQSLQGLVEGLVVIEKHVKELQDKKAWEPEGEKIALNSINELKIALEGLLQDESENDLIVLKDKTLKEEEEAKKKENKEEKPKDELVCELQEQNKKLTGQIEILMKQVQEMQLRLSQPVQPQHPFQWYLPPVNPYIQYPYYQAQGSTNIFILGNSSMPQLQAPSMIQGQVPQEFGQFQLPQQSQFQFPGQKIWNGSYDPSGVSSGPFMSGDFNNTQPGFFNFNQNLVSGLF
jgi:hypothetical protein